MDVNAGRLDHRVELMVTKTMDAEIGKVARQLAGAGSPRMFRSRAVRLLLTEAINARRAKEAKEAKKAAI